MGGGAIGEMLEKNTSLKILDLNHVPIFDIGVTSIVQKLELNPNSALIHLNLGRVPQIKTAGATAIGKMLSKNTVLKVLCLEGTSFGDDGTIPIMNSLSQNPHSALEELHINGFGYDCNSSWAVSDRSGDAIGKMLEQNTSLKRLLLDYNLIHDAGCKAIVEGLKENPNSVLERLDLRYNKFTGECGEAMVKMMLQKNRSLKVLWGNQW